MAELRLGENIVIPAIGFKRNQDKTITENGIYTADEGFTGLGEVTVNVPIRNQDKTITENGQYSADEGFTGLGTVTVSVPTIPSYWPPKTIVNGVLRNQNAATSYSIAPATDVDQHALAYAFYNCRELKTVDLSSLTAISGAAGLDYCFNYCTGLTSVDLSSLTTISGNAGLSGCFAYCTGLTTVDLSSLTTISGSSAMLYCFNRCNKLTSVDLSSLATISGSSAMQFCFFDCTSLTELRFPALQSFGASSTTITQFNGMLNGATGCTLHFPSNMQSEVERRTGYPNFGGTNTVILFDLPPTA